MPCSLGHSYLTTAKGQALTLSDISLALPNLFSTYSWGALLKIHTGHVTLCREPCSGFRSRSKIHASSSLRVLSDRDLNPEHLLLTHHGLGELAFLLLL